MNRTTIGKIFAILFPLVTYLIFGQRVRGLILFGLWIVSILLQAYIPFMTLAVVGIRVYTSWDAWKLVKNHEVPKFKNTSVDLGTGAGSLVDLSSKKKENGSLA